MQNGNEVELHLVVSAFTLSHPALRTCCVVLLATQGHNVYALITLWMYMHFFMRLMCKYALYEAVTWGAGRGLVVCG